MKLPEGLSLKVVVLLVFALVGLIYMFSVLPILGFIFLAVIVVAIIAVKSGEPKNAEEAEALRKHNEQLIAKKYNYYKYTCPMCGSKRVKNISTASKVVSTELVGLASNKIGKSYECDDCQYKW